MPINHHVLIRFNLSASKEICLGAARKLDLAPELIERATAESNIDIVREVIYSAILDKIISLREIINADYSSPIIFEASWSKNAATVAADRALTETHGVSHKIEMVMQDEAAVEKYFSHPTHLALVSQFTELSAQDESIFLDGGFAIPFDTKRPTTPRTAAEIMIKKRVIPFRNPEEARIWALSFKNQFRDGGFSRDDDLAALATSVEHLFPEYSAAIRPVLE